MVECRTCGLLRLDPQPSPEELRTYYPANYWFTPGGAMAQNLEEQYRRFVLLDHVRFVEGALERAGEGLVLDVGCGGGLFLRLLKERGRSGVMGLDFADDAAAIAWRRNGVPAVCGSLPDAPLPPASCAAITMFHVLEHLPDPAAYLTAARALLQPEGRLVVQVPNAACWQFMLFGENWNGIDVPRHLIDFRLRDLERLLDGAGFEVVRTKHFSLRDNPAGFASSLAPALDPMARRIRGVAESPAWAMCKNGLYLGLTLAALPFTLLEAACRAGSTIMIEARKKGA